MEKYGVKMDMALHRFMQVDYSPCAGKTERDGYLAFYHEDGLYSVRNLNSGIVSLVHAKSPYGAIERVSIDSIPVRCKDCIYWSNAVAGATEHVKLCKIGRYMVGENGYCVYGERKE